MKNLFKSNKLKKCMDSFNITEHSILSEYIPMDDDLIFFRKSKEKGIIVSGHYTEINNIKGILFSITELTESLYVFYPDTIGNQEFYDEDDLITLIQKNMFL